MSDTALVIAIMGFSSMATKSAGPLLFGGREPSPRLAATTSMIGAALLAALITYTVLEKEGGLAVDERLVGLGGAWVMLRLRLPVLVVVAGAATVTASIRLL